MGGLVMGVLSALPLINICCCLWIISGGLIAAYLLQQNHSEPIAPGDGAIVGLLAGIAGALVQFVVSIPIGLLMAPIERSMMQRAVEMAGNMPPALREVLESYGAQRQGMNVVAIVVIRLFSLFFALIVGGVFSTLGGVLGAVVFRRVQPLIAPPPPSNPA
jgi:hypothetical protein